MKYELQFTVKTDAVKQNRKLPEIAFFDTDGNPISLGGGGSVDVSGLLPRDGSRAMTGPLDLGGPSLVYGDSEQWGEDYSVLSLLGLDSEFDVVGASLGAIAHDGSTFGSLNPTGTLRLSPVDDYQAIVVNPSGGGFQPSFVVMTDGSIHWGDGIVAPDTHLGRVPDSDPNWGWLHGLKLDSGGLIISDDQSNGLYVMDPRGTPWDSWANLFTNQASDSSYVLLKNLGEGMAALGVGADIGGLRFTDAGSASPHFAVDLDGSIHWGDGEAAPDTILSRLQAGSLVIGDATMAGGAIQLEGDNDPVWGGSLYLQLDGTSHAWMGLVPSNGQIQIGWRGGGIRLTSPDGTQTKLVRLSNAGALELV